MTSSGSGDGHAVAHSGPAGPTGGELTAPEAARHAVDRYRAIGRSALIRVRTQSADWEYGVDPDRPYEAASLLKLGIAIAAEERIVRGDIDSVESVTVRQLGARPDDHSVLDLLDPGTVVPLGNVVALMIGASDNTCSRWLLSLIGVDAVEAAIASAGCVSTTIQREAPHGVPVAGVTTCRDALDLLAVASDSDRYPITARALRHSIRNSRIPLGATSADVTIAHKTGSLAGVAHDVAVLECDSGRVELAFLTDGQHDTLVAGYAMGICTREVLTAFGLSTRSSVSVDGG